MKKIFATAIAMVAFTGVTSAQDMILEIDNTDGTTKRYDATEIESVTFAYNPWARVARGTYTFGGMCFTGGLDLLPLYQNTEETDQWRINNWLSDYGGPLNFIYDEQTGDVYVPDQSTSYEGATLVGDDYYTGDVQVCAASYLNWMLTDEPEDSYEFQSYYDAETETFHFAVGYYIWIGTNTIANFGYTGYTSSYRTEPWGEELFEITSHLTTSAPKAETGKDLTRMLGAKKPQVEGQAEIFTIKK